MNENNLLKLAQETAIKAGIAILKIYETNDFEVEQKTDDTPITRADKMAHQIIVEGLAETQIPIISEEGKIPAYEERKSWQRFWLIDPLDGTKEFIKKNGEFTVNIALIEGGKVVLGVIFVPVSGELYCGEVGEKATKSYYKNGKIGQEEILPLPQNEREDCVVVASRSFRDEKTEQYIAGITKKVQLVSRGSSLKFCMIAEGTADIYPRFVNLKEWDIAGGVAIVEAMGKTVINAETNEKICFNSPNLQAPCFIAK